jgi:hypothetical protein
MSDNEHPTLDLSGCESDLWCAGNLLCQVDYTVLSN